MLMGLLGYGFSAAQTAEGTAIAKSKEATKMEIQDLGLPSSPIPLHIADILSYGSNSK
jgi:hypothetical protein